LNPQPSSSPARRALRRGFTLVELLIAIGLSSVVIISAYFMFTSSSELFNHQEMVVDNQNALRFSLSIMRNDIAKAGHNLSPNPGFDPMICPPNLGYASIQVSNDTVTGIAEPINFQRIYIAGDMSGMPEPARVTTVGATSITYAPSVDAGVAASFFEPPAMAALRTPDGMVHYRTVVSSTPNLVTITPPLPLGAGGPCSVSPLAAENYELMPIVAVVYQLERDTQPGAAANKVDLVRYVVNPSIPAFQTAPQTDPGGVRTVVTDWAVGLRFSVLGTPGLPGVNAVPFEDPDELFDFDGELNTPDLGLVPQRARFVLYRVQTATRRAVPRRLAMPTISFDPTSSEPGFYPLGNGRFAEIRTQQGRIELINFSLRNLP
jgi:prepilin-type N-terminal cleavage/methylation domain-containing protein